MENDQVPENDYNDQYNDNSNKKVSINIYYY